VRKQWIKEGIISELALVPPFRSPDVYLEYFPETPTTGIPLLDEINTSTGYRNQHHLSYVYAGERYLSDSVSMIIHAPRYYLNIIPHSIYIFLHSASDYNHTYDIRKPIDEWDTTWNRLFYGQWQKDESVSERVSAFSLDHVAWWLAVGFLIVITATPVYLWRQRTGYQNLDYGLILFIFWNIFFVFAAGILVEFGENNRFRFVIDPLILLLDAFFVIRAIENIRYKFQQDSPQKINSG
jgi:hypothetical protein